MNGGFLQVARFKDGNLPRMVNKEVLAEFIYKPTQLTEKLFTMKKSSIPEKSSLATNNT